MLTKLRFADAKRLGGSKVTPNARNKEIYGVEKATFTEKALILSRTVVEKEGYVSTGVLSHIEGEMMEIEMTEFKSFDLGNPVDLTIYSPVGIHRLQSTVIGKAEGSIAVLFPPRALVGLEEKRETPRVEIGHNGTLKRTIYETRELKDGPETFEFTESVNLYVRNISCSGIGFIVSEGPRILVSEVVEATIMLGSEFHCSLEIMRSEFDGGQSFYGARFCELDAHRQRALRAFILREQVASYYRRKEEKPGEERS
jgi:hypothetical protein